MPSLIAGYEYDIFISYRHNDNRSGWVTEFVDALQVELAATIKEPLSIYFDKNPHDGLQQHHEVDESLRLKLKSLVLIPIVSQTYCDTKAFAWEHELLPFIQQASNDSLGLKTKVSGGNIANRVLPVKIHDIDNDDKHLFEEATGSALRSIDFIYKESGVNRPLRPTDNWDRNQEHIDYRNQVNKVANAIKEIIAGLRNQQDNSIVENPSVVKEAPKIKHKPKRKINWKSKIPKIPIFKLSLVSILLAVGLIVISYLHFRETDIEVQTIRSAIAPAEGTRYWESSGSNFELSPDGKLLAYVAIDSAGNSSIWVRPLNSIAGQALSGTETATVPFWSPDSRFIGFFANGKLKKIPASGGPVQILCEAVFGRGGTWNKDGTIVFCPNVNQPLFKVSSAGGTPIAVTKLDSIQEHKSHRYPYFLPDGKHFIYLARTAIAADGLKDAVYVGSLDTTFTPKLIAPVKTSIAYANSHLLYLNGQTLMAQPFDPRSLQTTGDALPVAEHVGYVPISAKGSFSVSQNGLLVYMIGAGNYQRNLVWRDRNSNVLATIERNENYIEYRISPDEKKLIVSMTVSNSNVGDTDIWLYEIDRKTWTRFTFDATTPQRWPIWSPDGNTIMYSSMYKGIYNLFMRPSNGSSAEKLVLESNDIKRPMDWSADGRYVIYEVGKGGQNDLWVLPMTGQQAGKPFPFLETPFDETRAVFSPDGRWVSYASNESGRWEVYIRPFPGPGGKWQVSTDGGTYSRWRANGKEIFYFNPYIDNYIRAAEIKSSASAIESSAPKKLVQYNITSGLNLGYFDVNGKGDRFLFREGQNDADETPLTLVTNWPEEIKRK